MRETDRRFCKFPEINIPIGVENSESEVPIEIKSVSLRRYESVSCLIVRVIFLFSLLLSRVFFSSDLSLSLVFGQ